MDVINFTNWRLIFLAFWREIHYFFLWVLCAVFPHVSTWFTDVYCPHGSRLSTWRCIQRPGKFLELHCPECLPGSIFPVLLFISMQCKIYSGWFQTATQCCVANSRAVLHSTEVGRQLIGPWTPALLKSFHCLLRGQDVSCDTLVVTKFHNHYVVVCQ